MYMSRHTVSLSVHVRMHGQSIHMSMYVRVYDRSTAPVSVKHRGLYTVLSDLVLVKTGGNKANSHYTQLCIHTYALLCVWLCTVV